MGAAGWLIGLSQGLTEGTLGKQRQEQDDFRKLQDLWVNQMHLDAGKARPEDLPKFIEHIHNITVAKDKKQLDAAVGNYGSSVMSEDYAREQAIRAQNEAQGAAAGAGAQGVAGPVGSPQTPMDSGDYGDPGFDRTGPPTNDPGFDRTGPETGDTGFGVESSQTTRPQRGISMQAPPQYTPQDPNAYAKSKIRFQSTEGMIGRQIEVAQAKGEIATETAVAKEKARGEREVANIEAKLKSQGAKDVKLIQDSEGNAAFAGIGKDGNPFVHSLAGYKIPAVVMNELRVKQSAATKEAELKERKRLNDSIIETNDRKATVAEEKFKDLVRVNDEKLRTGYFDKSKNGTLVKNQVGDAVKLAQVELSDLKTRFIDTGKEIRAIAQGELLTPTEGGNKRLAYLHALQDSIAVDMEAATKRLKERVNSITSSAGEGAATTGLKFNKETIKTREPEIRSFLKSKGYSDEQIEAVIAKYK